MENLTIADSSSSHAGGANNPQNAQQLPPQLPQLPPQMFTTAAQLLDLTDSEGHFS
jgi:U6 snRNA-associated Sm-like protein LSm1